MTVDKELKGHLRSRSNPHGVRAHQTGAYELVGGQPLEAPLNLSALATLLKNVTPQSSPPGSPVVGDIYLDDGTNTDSTYVGFRYYNGATWEDIGAIAGGGGAGEANTASSAGSGTSLYYTKAGVDLQFNAIKSENNRLTVSLDSGTHDVELTVNEGNIVHDNLSGVTANNHHNQSHLISSTSDHTAVGNSVLYADNSGDIIELSLSSTSGQVLASQGAAVAPAFISHDAIDGAVANEHIDHTSVTMTAGAGLSGGGDISANRSFAIDIMELDTETSADGQNDYVLMYDASESAHNKITVKNIAGGILHSDLGSLGTDEHTEYFLADGTRTLTGTIKTGAVTKPIRIAAQSAEPGSPVAGDIYLDDGTNTIFETEGLRWYEGGGWTDLGINLVAGHSHVYPVVSSEGGQVDHGHLAGLGDNDHTQYPTVNVAGTTTGIKIWGGITVFSSQSSKAVTLPGSYTSSSTYAAFAGNQATGDPAYFIRAEHDSASQITIVMSASMSGNVGWITIGY